MRGTPSPWLAIARAIVDPNGPPPMPARDRRLSSIPLHELEDEIRALEDEDLEAALAQHRMERLP